MKAGAGLFSIAGVDAPLQSSPKVIDWAVARSKHLRTLEIRAERLALIIVPASKLYGDGEAGWCLTAPYGVEGHEYDAFGIPATDFNMLEEFIAVIERE